MALVGGGGAAGRGQPGIEAPGAGREGDLVERLLRRARDVEGGRSRWSESLPSDAASPAHNASPFPAGARRSPQVPLTVESLLRCSRRRRITALPRGSRRRLLALRLCRGLIQSSRARGAVVIASPNRSCPAQPGRERNHRHHRPPPIARPAPRDFDRCCRMRALGQRRRAQRWRGSLRLSCRGRLRRRLAGVEEFRARSFGQIRIDERQLRTERLDRESVPGAKRQMTRSATPAAFGTHRDPGQARGRESKCKEWPREESNLRTRIRSPPLFR
jgi:hypothetical protein